jgi:hypothetical protein
MAATLCLIRALLAISKAGRKPGCQADRPVGHTEQQRPRIDGVGIGELLCVALTLCWGRNIADSESRSTYSCEKSA